MDRAESRRLLRVRLKNFLRSKGTSWRQYRDYLGAKHKLSLNNRDKLVIHSFGLKQAEAL